MAQGERCLAQKENKAVFYQIVWNADNVTGNIFINGFLIAELNGPQGSGSAALNVWLLGNNQLKAGIQKSDQSKPALFNMGVSMFKSGDVVDTTQRGNLFSLEKKDSDFTKGKALVVSSDFKSTFDFTKTLSGGSAANSKDLTAYAVKIHRLFAAKKADDIIKEFSVKLEDYDIAFSSTGSAEEFKSILVHEILKGKLEKINPSRLKALMQGPGGAVWHVMEGEKELIRIAYPDGVSEIPVYIARIDGKLKVVR